VATPPPDEEAIFQAARRIAAPAARQEYVRRACGADAALAARVEALLAAHDEPGSFLREPPFVRGVRDAAAAGPPPDDAEVLALLAPSELPSSLGRLAHYEVLEVVGRGGFGVVFRAFDDMLQRVVAVKVLAPSLAATSPARKRFLREARSAAPIRHENVVRIHEVGEQPLPYLVMEFVPGETLQQRLDRTGPLEVPEVLRIARQVAEGLAAAHAAGLIHRDIKPANILIDAGPQHARITDFGLARAADDASLTGSGFVAGTPMYMAPEQARGESLDHRADLFSLGSVLYAMLTGRPPFRAATTLAVLKRVAEEDPRPIREVIPEVPEWLCRIVARLHAKDPAERFQTAREAADVLADCEVRQKAGGSAEAGGRAPPAGADETPRGAGPTPAARRRRRWRLAAVALLLLAAALGAAEAAGVTRLRAAVVRVFTPDGTPVVETDDPGVRVTGEGDGGRVITGAGPQKVRDRVEAQPEAATAPPPSPIPPDRPFVVLGRNGEPDRGFKTLAEAGGAARAGDTIEIRGNGPFPTTPLQFGAVGLTIRAGARACPVIVPDPAVEWKTGMALFQASRSLTLEGLDIHIHFPEYRGPRMTVNAVEPRGAAVFRLVNCRIRHAFSEFVTGTAIWVTGNTEIRVRNCQLMGPGFILDFPLEEPVRVELENNVMATNGSSLLCRNGRWPTRDRVPAPGVLEMADNSFWIPNGVGLTSPVYGPSAGPPGAAEGSEPKQLRVLSTRNVFGTSPRVVSFQWFPGVPGTAHSSAELKEAIRQGIEWREEANLYPDHGALVYGYQTSYGSPPGFSGVRQHFASTLDEWNRFWGLTDTGSVRGPVRCAAGTPSQVAEILRGDPKSVLPPEAFRLDRNNASHAAGPGGRDLGPDVGLVGPGPAYERWKATPMYREWIKTTGPMK
jgi:hypothetical protein